MKRLLVTLLALLPTGAFAADRVNRFEIEAGALSTENMEIHGFQQANATEGWSKSAPAVRLEYWRTKEDGWNYGLVYQPLSVSYKDVLKSNLQYKGKTFRAGDAGSLDYEFPTLRFTANKPVYRGEDQSYLRVGASVVVRYARVALATGTQSFSDTNLLAIPLLNIEGSRPLGAGYSLYTRSDFLPAFGGNVLKDGLYDLFLGVKKTTPKGRDIEVGIRLFFGGYDPDKPDDYANRISFRSFVVRYAF